EGELELAGMEVWEEIVDVIGRGWEEVFGRDVKVRTWSWRAEEATQVGGRVDTAKIRITGWFPGYADPEYFLRLLFQSDSRTNDGGFAYPAFDDLIERARQERSDRGRLHLFHEADRMAVVDRVAVIPLVYGRSLAMVKPWINGWWEFGKSSTSIHGWRQGSKTAGKPFRQSAAWMQYVGSHVTTIWSLAYSFVIPAPYRASSRD